MANIDVRKSNDKVTTPAAVESGRWEPFRMMRELMGWDPFREMAPFAPSFPTGFIPSFDVKESADGYRFKADVPGVKEADIQVMMTGNRLTISGKREAEKKEQNDTFYAYERSHGEFTRAFTLPEGVDTSSVNADLKDGVLTIDIKKAPEMQPKKIAIQTPAKKS